ncbi:fumarylpyruvate hydrolase [Pseudoduganella flava]|uniref:FAA hydrolase family protein n=1 Tax=Pseudoduganella flava TaxID=871742 RepID=A0A562PTM4_9BURK|nr:fumarylacetoacetate hydrolase family protein [Pseudoduganella flava]QGZ39022.1 FAA hydrolase family protein [Pseudoduganella flava]TWI47713.1 fumarylpyruvate hydrolase [Pseudoduganella flava]
MSTSYVFAPHQAAALPVAGSAALFPVRRVYCVGRNYAGHAREMGSDPNREPPFFFCKPGDADAVVAVPAGATVELPFPPRTEDFHHECELVVAIGKGGANIPAADAPSHIFGYAVGLDMTRRDLQGQMKAAGRPWEIGKAFDFSAPVGSVHPAASVPGIGNAAIALQVDGAVKQSGHVADMIWSIAETIANLSTLFTLQPGDLIFTGTPEGVGAVQRGQLLTAHVDGLTDIAVRYV